MDEFVYFSFRRIRLGQAFRPQIHRHRRPDLLSGSLRNRRRRIRRKAPSKLPSRLKLPDRRRTNRHWKSNPIKPNPTKSNPENITPPQIA
jgi:hypothetical protein